MKYLITFIFLLAFACTQVCAEEPIPIAYNTDPPIVIDGALNDWQAIPNELALDENGQLSRNSGKANSKSRAKFAWRKGRLYVSVYSDLALPENLSSGYLVLTVDAISANSKKPSESEPVQIILSLAANKAVDSKVQAKALQTIPAKGAIDDIEFVSVASGKGWLLEASLPWSLFEKG